MIAQKGPTIHAALPGTIVIWTLITLEADRLLEQRLEAMRRQHDIGGQEGLQLAHELLARSGILAAPLAQRLEIQLVRAHEKTAQLVQPLDVVLERGQLVAQAFERVENLAVLQVLQVLLLQDEKSHVRDSGAFDLKMSQIFD